MLKVTETRTARHAAEAPADLGRELTEGFAHRFIRSKGRQLVKQKKIAVADRLDIEQDLRMQVLTAAPSFDVARADWPAFVTTVVERHVATILEHRCRSKRAGDGDLVSLSQMLDDDGVGAEELVGAEDDPGLKRVDDDDELTTLLARLPDDTRDICARLRHQSISAVARDLGVPRSTVSSAIVRLRQQIEFEKTSANGQKPSSTPGETR